MTIKTKMKINLYLFLLMSAYMALEWYENAIINALSIGGIPVP